MCVQILVHIVLKEVLVYFVHINTLAVCTLNCSSFLLMSVTVYFFIRMMTTEDMANIITNATVTAIINVRFSTIVQNKIWHYPHTGNSPLWE